MFLFQCNQCIVMDKGKPTTLVFEAALPVCPNCQAKPPITGTATIVHLAYHNPNGPLSGYLGRKVAVACAGITVGADPNNCMTSLPYLVNCPRCKKTDIYKKLWHPDPSDIMDYFNNPSLPAPSGPNEKPEENKPQENKPQENKPAEQVPDFIKHNEENKDDPGKLIFSPPTQT